ncbi:MAG: flavodoxin family protein [Bilifractor sp.]
MSRIIVFKGSPRKNSFSTKLLEQVVKGAKSKGAAIAAYDLNDPDIRGCQGCYYCRNHEGCATKDALQPMYKDIAEADGIAVSFPLYFGGINGQCKSWLDRMYPMLGSDNKPRCPGKKIVTIFAQGNANPEFLKSTIDQTNLFFKIFGWELQDSLLAYGTQNPEYKLPEELLKSAYEAGEKLV